MFAGKLNSTCSYGVRRYTSCQLPPASDSMFVVENIDILIPVSVAAGEEQHFLSYSGQEQSWEDSGLHPALTRGHRIASCQSRSQEMSKR